MQPYIASYHLLDIALNNTRGTTCGKARPSVAVTFCHTWSGGPSVAAKISVHGPGGPAVAGDHLQHDKTKY